MTLNTKKEWLAYAREQEEVLLTFLEAWHPTSPHRKPLSSSFNITAEGAEAACAQVREHIASKELLEPSAAVRFHKAMAEEDYAAIYNLLNSAWFGVPESTSCWSIPGFAEAVNLLENPLQSEELP